MFKNHYNRNKNIEKIYCDDLRSMNDELIRYVEKKMNFQKMNICENENV